MEVSLTKAMAMELAITMKSSMTEKKFTGNGSDNRTGNDNKSVPGNGNGNDNGSVAFLAIEWKQRELSGRSWRNKTRRLSLNGFLTQTAFAPDFLRPPFFSQSGKKKISDHFLSRVKKMQKSVMNHC